MKKLAKVSLALALFSLSLGAWARPTEREARGREETWTMVLQQADRVNQRDARTHRAGAKCAWCLRDWCYNGYCCDQKDTNCNGECEIISGTCYHQ